MKNCLEGCFQGSWKQSGAQNTSTLRLTLKKLCFHVTVKEQTVLKKTSMSSHIPTPDRAPTECLPWTGPSTLIPMRPLGKEGGRWRGPSQEGYPCLFKEPCSLGQGRLFPTVVPCLEITCTVSHSHLVFFFPLKFRYCLFLKRKEGASEV